MDTLTEALTHHDKGLVSKDPTIGVCWDADRLTLWRLNRQPDPALLSTPAARALTSRAASQWYGLYRFVWKAIFLNFDHLTDGAVDRDLGGSPYPGESVYLRFGEMPPGGRSNYHYFAPGIGQEFGVSVYRGQRLENGTYHIDLRRGMCGLDTRFLRSLLCYARPLHVVSGSHVGIGGAGEPLLRDAKIVEEVAPGDFAGFVPARDFLRNATDYWRAKRTGEPLPSMDFLWSSEREERLFVPRQSEGPQSNFAEEVEQKKRELLKRWGFLEDYDEMQREQAARDYSERVREAGPWTPGRGREIAARLQETPWNQSFTQSFSPREALWKQQEARWSRGS
jgi:hypothetical protein